MAKSLAGEYLNLASSGFDGSLDMSGDAVLVKANIYGCDFTSTSFSNCTALELLESSDCTSLTSANLSGCSSLAYVSMAGCALTESAVDAILAALDTAGLSNGTVDVSGGTNAIPSAAGLTSKTNLEGKGWTVTVNA
jgi:uncharacterized protein YjbI with pentapeptide repeats